MDADDFDKNLDTQRRRLDAMDAAIAAALSDEPQAAELPVPDTYQQSYTELTSYNTELRASKGWTEVDLDAALSPAQAAALEQWRGMQRIPWSTADLVAVGLAGALGGTVVWFDATIDGVVRDRLLNLTKTQMGQAFEKAGKRLPIDYMGPGFGGRAHRVKSASHDLARPLKALRQIMDGQFDGVVWSFGERSDVVVSGQFDQVNSFEEALMRWLMHLGADVFTTMSLPIPGFSLLYEMDNETVRNFALHAYSGLRAGEGLNLRSAIAAPGMTTTVTELIIRTHSHLSALRAHGSPTLTRSEERKHTELQVAAHSLVTAASIGKAVGQALLSEFGPHPGHIRHVNIPSLMMAGRSAIQVVSDVLDERRASAPTWDELVLGSAQPWQLDVACTIEATWPSL